MQKDERYIDQLAAATPTPGGGAAAGHAGAMGAALCEMVAGLTANRRQYASVHSEIAELKQNASLLRAELEQAIVDDAYVYQRVITVLSHRTEKNDRTVIQAIEDALVGAAQVPLNVMKLSLQVTDIAARLTEIGLHHATADAAAAASLARSAASISRINIFANLKDVENKKLVKSWTNQADRIMAEINEKVEGIEAHAKKRISEPARSGRARRRNRSDKNRE